MDPSRSLLDTLARMTLLLLLAIVPAPTAAPAERPLMVYAAASLKNALDEIAAGWQAQTGTTVTLIYAASSAAAKQIAAGAPADVFLSADLAWMDHLDTHALIEPRSRVDLLGNRLVLIAPRGRGVRARIAPGFALARLLGEGRLALGDPAAVPAGRYARAALESLGVWAPVEARIAPAENVRAALLFVSRGEAPFGIVYRTDAAADPGVEIVDTFPEASHPPIVYPIARLAASRHPGARAFIAHLRTDAARRVFERHGFRVLP